MGCMGCLVMFVPGLHRLTTWYALALHRWRGARHLATFGIEIWDHAGEPRVLVRSRLHVHDSRYSLDRIMSLMIPLLTEHMMATLEGSELEELRQGMKAAVEHLKSDVLSDCAFDPSDLTSRRVTVLGVEFVYFPQQQWPKVVVFLPNRVSRPPKWAGITAEMLVAKGLGALLKCQPDTLPKEARDFVLWVLEQQLAEWGGWRLGRLAQWFRQQQQAGAASL